jgi:hypothetical protein
MKWPLTPWLSEAKVESEAKVSRKRQALICCEGKGSGEIALGCIIEAEIGGLGAPMSPRSFTVRHSRHPWLVKWG